MNSDAEQIVDAVWRCHSYDEDGNLWMDRLKATAKVKAILFAATGAGEEARSLQQRLFDECVTANWDPERRNTFAEEIAHLHEELSEAFRAWRQYKDFGIHYSPTGKPEGVPVELADTLIGLFYNAQLHGFDLLAAVEIKHQFNLTRNYVSEGRQLHATPPASSTTESSWCEPCKSFHPAPRDEAHKAELKCVNPVTAPAIDLPSIAPSTTSDGGIYPTDDIYGATEEFWPASAIAPAAAESWATTHVIHEDELPPGLSKNDYDTWYLLSWIQDGVRVGPRPPSTTTSNASEAAREIVGTVFQNTAASYKTLEATMIERVTDYLTEEAAWRHDHEKLMLESMAAQGRWIERLRAELSDARANAIREAVDEARKVVKGWRSDLDESWDERPDLSFEAADKIAGANEIIAALQSLADKKEGEDGPTT